MNTVDIIREIFKDKLARGELADDGNLEIVNACFIADEETIFGEVNHEWVRREKTWYMRQSLNVCDIEPPVPTIWKNIASIYGEINSNYGWCVLSKENGEQYAKAVESLKTNKNSRQAVMIYNRPSMHEDSKRDGMRDFICTYAVQLLIRNNQLHYMVFMRSSDSVYGYKGDKAWHDAVHKMALSNLSYTYPGLEMGTMYWTAGSLHIYPRHFHLVK